MECALEGTSQLERSVLWKTLRIGIECALEGASYFWLLALGGGRFD